MVDDAKVAALRNSGAEAKMGDYEPTIDGQSWDEFMEDAREEAMETPEGRLIILQKKRDKLLADQARKAKIKELKARRDELKAQQFGGPYAEGFDPASGEQVPPPPPPPEEEDWTRSNNPLKFIDGNVAKSGRRALAGADLARIAVSGIVKVGTDAVTELPGLGNALMDDVRAEVALRAKGETGEGINIVNELDAAANRMNQRSEDWSAWMQPVTAGSKEALLWAAPKLQWLDDKMLDGAEYAAGGDPEKATAYYVAMNGILDALPLGAAARAGKTTMQAQIARRGVAVKAMADKYGLQLKDNLFTDSALKGFKERGESTYRAKNMPQLAKDLAETRAASRAKREALKNNARSLGGAIKAGDVKAFAQAMKEKLIIESIDIYAPGMDAVRDVLDNMLEIEKASPLTGKRKTPGEPSNIVDQQVAGGTRRVRVDNNEAPALILPQRLRKELDEAELAKADEIAVSLNEMNTLYDRIGSARKTSAKKDALTPETDPNRALGMIEKQLNRMVSEKYADDMMGGDKGAIAAWNNARDFQRKHAKLFTAEAAVEKIAREGAVPTEVRALVVGASETAPKGTAVRIVRNLKEILGPDHPSIKGIRADYLHEMLRPLMHTDGPKIKQFMNNLDNHMDKNRQLMGELGFSPQDIAELKSIGMVMEKLAPIGGKYEGIFSSTFLGTAIARLTVGHQIAKAGVRVSIARRVMHALLGADAVSQKQIISMLAEGTQGPVLPAHSASSVRALQMGIAADIDETTRMAVEPFKNETGK